MRSGIEKKMHDFYLNELKLNSGNPVWAMESLDYLIFHTHKDEFYNLNEEEQMEVRLYLHTIQLIHKTNR